MTMKSRRWAAPTWARNSLPQQRTDCALSWWFEERSTLALIWHQYTQVEAADFLRDAEVDGALNGIDRDLGQELDLVLGSRHFENFDIELAAGRFFAGDAFSSQDEDATLFRAQIRYRF